jgi:hypothetical protein
MTEERQGRGLRRHESPAGPITADPEAMVVRDGCPGVAGVSQVMEVNPARSALPDHRGTAATPIPTSVMRHKLAS